MVCEAFIFLYFSIPSYIRCEDRHKVVWFDGVNVTTIYKRKRTKK